VWVGHEFAGDDNQTLKDVQFRLYSEMLLRLFSGPRDRYLAASRLIQVDTELAVHVRAMDGFDHRTLQDAHDLIAAWYRFSRDDGGQLRLGESPDDYDKRLAQEWREFSEREVARLASTDEFTRDILTAAVFANTDRGYAAESGAREYLKDRYATMYRPRKSADDNAV
jgi:hypothetical protein